MSGGSPGRRQAGRMAFIPGADPEKHNPYERVKSAAMAVLKSIDWLEGWNEAKARYTEPVASESDAEYLFDLASRILPSPANVGHDDQTRLNEIARAMIQD